MMYKNGKNFTGHFELYFILHRQIQSQKDWRTFSILQNNSVTVALLWLLILHLFPPVFSKKCGTTGLCIYRKIFNVTLWRLLYVQGLVSLETIQRAAESSEGHWIYLLKKHKYLILAERHLLLTSTMTSFTISKCWVSFTWVSSILLTAVLSHSWGLPLIITSGRTVLPILPKMGPMSILHYSLSQSYTISLPHNTTMWNYFIY